MAASGFERLVPVCSFAKDNPAIAPNPGRRLPHIIGTRCTASFLAGIQITIFCRILNETLQQLGCHKGLGRGLFCGKLVLSHSVEVLRGYRCC